MYGLVGPQVYITNHLLNLLGRLLGSVRQCPHLVGYYRKTTPCIPCPRGLDGGIQCQQISLLSNRADHVQHLADIAHLASQSLDLRGSLGHISCEQPDRIHCPNNLLTTMLGRLVRFS